MCASAQGKPRMARALNWYSHEIIKQMCSPNELQHPVGRAVLSEFNLFRKKAFRFKQESRNSVDELILIECDSRYLVEFMLRETAGPVVVFTYRLAEDTQPTTRILQFPNSTSSDPKSQIAELADASIRFILFLADGKEAEALKLVVPIDSSAAV